jgi:mono/diheme cytochrome c family protein
MRKVLKVLTIIVILLVLIVSGLAAYLKFVLPSVGDAPTLTIEKTPERIERGKYLANAVMGCMDCHTERDWTKYPGPIKTDSLGAGSTIYGHAIGLPGEFHSKNLTPYHLGNWTDGEIFRAVTTGVNKDGKALFPLMPYNNFGKLDREDIYAVIAYLRTLPPVKRDVAPSDADFPVNFIINTMPAKASFTKKPDEGNTVAYGKYLVTAAGCADCHSQSDKGTAVAGKEFAGGNQFHVFGYTVTSTNITPHETGIKNWTKDAFISRFKMYSEANYKPIPTTANDANTPMPWTNFANMSEKDLGAIYDYLRTVPPVKNEVVKFVKNKRNNTETVSN